MTSTVRMTSKLVWLVALSTDVKSKGAKLIENIRIVKNALTWLSRSQKWKFGALVSLNASLALIDLVGLSLFALLGTIAVRGVQSIDLSPRTNKILEYLNLNNLSGNNIIATLAIAASLLLIGKTLISIILNRKTQVFLARTGAFGSTTYIDNVLSHDLGILERTNLVSLRFNATHGSRALFSGILGGFVTFVTDGFLLVIMLTAIFLSSPLVAVASSALFVSAAVILHFIQRHKAFVLGTEGAEVQQQAERDLLLATQGFRELYATNNLQVMKKRIENRFFKIASINAEMSILPNIGKYVIEITLILGTLMAAAIQITIADAARATSVMAVFLVAASRVAPALLRIQQGILSVKANYGTAFNFISNFEEIKSEVQKKSLQENRQVSVKGGHQKENLVDSNFPGTCIDISQVSFAYPNTFKNVFSNLNLRILTGEKVAIVGSSGSGKSTLLDLVLGLRIPYLGEIRIGNLPPHEAIRIWPNRISYVPQDTFLMEGGLLENIDFFGEAEELDIERLKQILVSLGLHVRIGDLDQLFESNLKMSELSGGEKQRIGLARALYRDPILLILDEATSSLDASLEKSVLESIMNQDNKTVISITHRARAIQMASRILFMSMGKITGDGTFEDLYENNLEFRNQIDVMRNLENKSENP